MDRGEDPVKGDDMMSTLTSTPQADPGVPDADERVGDGSLTCPHDLPFFHDGRCWPGHRYDNMGEYGPSVAPRTVPRDVTGVV